VYPSTRLKAGRQPLIEPFSFGRPIWTDWSTENANEHGLKASAVVYACIRKLSSAASSVPWRVEKRAEVDKWEPVPDHPIEMLLSHPNPFMTRQDLIERLTQHLNLGGNGVWHMVTRNGMPVELWPLAPDRIKPVPAPRKYISHYEYTIGGGQVKNLPTKEIIHFQFSNPGNPYWGMSPLQAVSRVVDTDIEAVNWNKVSLQNRAVPDGVFMINAPNATHQQWVEAREQVRRRYLDKGREPWVLFNVDYKQMSLSPVEMDFLNSRRYSREEIASVFGVLPILIGAMDGTTYNNIHTAKRIFWEDTIIPYLDDIRDALSITLLPYFDPTANDNTIQDEYRIIYDLSNISALQDNYGRKVKNAKLLFDMGIPMRHINQRLELGFLDEDIPEDAVRSPESVNSVGEVDPLSDDTDPKSVAVMVIREKLGPVIQVSARKAADQKLAGDDIAAVETMLAFQEELKRELDAVHDFLRSALGSVQDVNTVTQSELFVQSMALKIASLDTDSLSRFAKKAIVQVVHNFALMQVGLHAEGE
jgi:HK97 family phage portal protein